MSCADPLGLALGMPKSELHIHIEGSLEPGLAFALARRNGVALPYADEAALKAAYAFDSLQSFLDLYYACAAVLQTRADFRDLMLAYLERAAADGVIHAEIFFDPQTHTARGVPFATVLDGLDDGLAEGARRWGISGRLIMCFLRHLSEDECLAALAEAEPFAGRLHGFGLDSSERGHPPSKFARLFARCRALGRPVWPTPARRGRRLTSPRPSTSSARSASTTACGRRKTRRCSPAWPGKGCHSPSARSPTRGCACSGRWRSTACRSSSPRAPG